MTATLTVTLPVSRQSTIHFAWAIFEDDYCNCLRWLHHWVYLFIYMLCWYAVISLACQLRRVIAAVNRQRVVLFTKSFVYNGYMISHLIGWYT